MPDERRVFYVSFGQQHPLRDHFVRVLATDSTTAREAVSEVFGNKWSMMYTPLEMEGRTTYFPKGEVGEPIQGR